MHLITLSFSLKLKEFLLVFPVFFYSASLPEIMIVLSGAKQGTVPLRPCLGVWAQRFCPACSKEPTGSAPVWIF